MSPIASDQNFEIVILLNVVERAGNYVFEDDNPPTALRARVVSHTLGTYTIYTEKMIV